MLVQFMASKSAKPDQHEVSFAELAATLTAVERTETEKVNLPGWSPCELSKPWRNEANVIAVHCLVLDFDDISVEQWRHAQAQLEGFSWFWHSSYSYKPFSGQLRYRAVVELDRPVERKDWRRFFGAMANVLGVAPADKKKLWQCSDPCRFYFGPFCPMDGASPDVGIREGMPLPVDDILAEAPTQGSSKPEAPIVRSTRGLSHEELRAIVPRNVRRIDNPNTRAGYEALERLLGAEHYAEKGNRDNTLLYLSGILSRAFPFTEPDAIIAPVKDALDACDEEGQRSSAEVLKEKLVRDHAKLEAERAELARKELSSLGREGSYTADEVAEWCKDLGVTKEQLAGQLIVHTGADFYVFWEGQYKHVGSKEKAEPAIRARLKVTTAELPVTLGEDGPKGYVRKTFDKLLEDYGRHVFNVQKDLRLQYSRVDGETLHYAVRPRDPKLEPKHSPGVEAWLRSWKSPEVLDWLATAPKLEQATAALVLDGAKMTGKSQLARGLARLYKCRQPTPMHTLHDAFNDALTRCPVVYAEETIPWEFRRDTGLLKALITEDSKQLREKYQATAELIGHVRLVLARNDHKLFEAGEALTKATVDALTDRILYVHTGDSPAPFFESEEIAQHILWLMEHHPVPASSRGGLWVTGKPSRLHHRMRAFTSKVSASVCEWLLSFVERPTFCGDTAMKEFKLDSQGLCVTPRLVHEKWEMFAGKEIRQPTRAQVSDALEGMAVRAGNMYRVDLDVLAEYGDSTMHLLHTRTALQSAVEAAGVRLNKEAN